MLLDQFNFEKVEPRGARRLRLKCSEPPKAGSETKGADVTLMPHVASQSWTALKQFSVLTLA